MSQEERDRETKHRETPPNRERDLGTRLVDRVRQSVNDRWQEIDSEHSVDAVTALYLHPRDKCVPGWFIGDGMMDAIVDLYYEPLSAVRDELVDSNQLWLGEISICVMPSGELENIAIVHARQRVLPILERKAWLFWWKSEEEMQGELAQWYEAAEQGLTQDSTLLERHRHALRGSRARPATEVLGQVAVLLPGDERVRVVDKRRLQAAVEDLRGLI